MHRAVAGDRIGLAAVAQSPADGCTLVAATPIIAVAERLIADMAGRSKDFAGLCAIAAPPLMFMVRSGMPAKTQAEFITLAPAAASTWARSCCSSAPASSWPMWPTAASRRR